MAPTMKNLGIDRLSAEQRITLALEIWESLGEDRPRAGLSVEQQAELTCRDAELEANPGMAMTWEQILASIKSES